MLWTLAGLMLVMSLLLIHFLNKMIEKVKDAYFIYPSDAIIDQVLPAVSSLFKINKDYFTVVTKFLLISVVMQFNCVGNYGAHDDISRSSGCARVPLS